MTDQNGWPDASTPGVPLNPERDGTHVLDAGPDRTGKRRRIVALWACGRWHPLGADYYVLARDAANSDWQYVGPCHTPAEVAALVEAARREERDGLQASLDTIAAQRDAALKDGFLAGFREGAAKEREACAKVAEREMRDLFGDAEEYQQGWNAGIEAAVSRIRARGDA
jgi:hypothetical protein